MTCVLTRDREEMRQRRRPYEEGRRDWRDAATNQGTMEPPKPRRGRKTPPLEPAKGAWPCQHLDVGLLAPTVREHISMVLTTEFIALHHSSNGKPICLVLSMPILTLALPEC